MDTILFNENNTEPVRSTVNFSSLLHSVGIKHVGIQGERIFPMLNDFFMSCSFSPMLMGTEHTGHGMAEWKIENRKKDISSLLVATCVMVSAISSRIASAYKKDSVSLASSFYNKENEFVSRVSIKMRSVGTESESVNYIVSGEGDEESMVAAGNAVKKYFTWIVKANFGDSWEMEINKLFEIAGDNIAGGLERVCDKFLYPFAGIFPENIKAVWTYTDEDGKIWECEIGEKTQEP